MSKKLLCVIGQLGNGGSEKQLYLFLKYQKNYNTAVFVTGPEGGIWAERIKNDIGCPVYFTGNVSKLSKILHYRRILKEFNPDTVFSWSFFTNMMVYFSGKKTFIGSLRQQFSDENAASWSTKFCLSKKMNAIVVNSSLIKDELLGASYPEEKIKVILNIFETAPVKNDKDIVRSKILSDFSIPSESVIIIGIGRNSKVKNFDYFVDVIKEARKINKNIHALIIGSGGEGIRKKVEYENLNDSISLPGEIPDAKKYLPGADIFFLSSQKEGLPNVLIEALASGCACLATDVSGVRDVFQKIPENISEKMIIKDFDVKNAASQLLELVENSQLRAKCASFSDTVKEIFYPECILKQFENFL